MMQYSIGIQQYTTVSSMCTDHVHSFTYPIHHIIYTYRIFMVLYQSIELYGGRLGSIDIIINAMDHLNTIQQL